MNTKLIYLTHWRFPSEKTMTPLIMKTCAGFVEEGYEVELWVPRRHNPEYAGRDPFEVHGVRTRFRIRFIPALDLLRYLGPFGFLLMVATFNLSAFFLLAGRTKERIHLYAHDVRDVLLPCLLPFPTFVEIHDFYESGVRYINRFVFSRARGLIVTNTIKQKRIHEAYGFPLERMLHQPNAVEYGFFQTETTQEEARNMLGLPLDMRLAVYTGHLFSWKGVDTLALAARHLPEDTEVYFVGGTEEDRAALRSFVASHKIPRIHFLPHQEHARMPLFMKAADILVLPNTAREDASKYETSPVKLFEYMASGTPIVASDLPSIRDIVTGEEVRFFEPDNPGSLAAAVTDILERKEEARARARKAQDHAKRLSWEARAAAIAELMRRTVREETSRGPKE